MTDGKVEISYEKPVPREAKPPHRAERVRAQNRRREFLQRHPSYYESIEHELADPVLYERLVKRFQSAAERASDGRAKGYGRALEASLLRGETKLADLKASKEQADSSGERGQTHRVSPLGHDNEWDQPANDREQGLDLWKLYLEDRFVRGGDEDADYTRIDEDEDLDVWERQEDSVRWFDDEEPNWIEDEGDTKQGTRTGETGVQDY